MACTTLSLINIGTPGVPPDAPGATKPPAPKPHASAAGTVGPSGREFGERIVNRQTSESIQSWASPMEQGRT